MSPAPALDRAALIWTALGLLTIGAHLWIVFAGLLPNLVTRPVHMALALPWALVYAARGPWERATGLALATAGIAACLWVAGHAERLGDQYGFLEGPEQIALAALLLLTVLEAARRAVGWPLPAVAVLALAYRLLGQHIPGEFGHAGTPLPSFLGTLTIAEGGLWGSLTGISVTLVAIFVIFGAVLNAGTAGRGFMALAAAGAGRFRGGAAKVSVLSSAFFGSISGSASANVASTGAITLPAMARLGYPKPLAGAVEAVASSGGQILPPLMGAGAFVMVELTGVPYTGVMAAALPPALLYFVAVWVGIDAFARVHGLRPLGPEDRPGAREVLLTSAFFALPFGLLLWGMFGQGLTPQRAAIWALLAAAGLLLLDDRLRVVPRDALARAQAAALAAGQQVALIASVILCASIVIGVLGITGAGVKITSLILSASGGLLVPSLLLTALACLILGMEVPTTAAYVICVSVAGPALVALGLQPLTAHLYVFWYALLSTITPPVCGAVFIAAGMVGENWLRVAVRAMALGLGLYLVPLAMIANPGLLDLGARPFAALGALLKVGIGLVLISEAVIIARRGAARRASLLGLGSAFLFLPGP